MSALEDARRKNGIKGKALFMALVCEAAAVGFVAAAVGIIL